MGTKCVSRHQAQINLRDKTCGTMKEERRWMRLNTAPNDSRKNTKYYRFYSERIHHITAYILKEYRILRSVIRVNTGNYTV